MPARVPAQIEGLLFAAALKPLAQPLGFFGDVVIDNVAQRIAANLQRARD